MKLTWIPACISVHLIMVLGAAAQILRVGSWENGQLLWDDTFSNGFYQVQWAESLTGLWHASWEGLSNIVALGTGTQARAVPMFYRVVFCPNEVNPSMPIGGSAQLQKPSQASGIHSQEITTREFGGNLREADSDTNTAPDQHSEIPTVLSSDVPFLHAGATQGILITGGSGGKATSRSMMQADRHFNVTLASGTFAEFALTLHSEIKRQIKAHGGRLTSDGYSTSEVTMRRMSYSYNWARNIGIVQVLLLDGYNDHILISLCCYEHP